MMELIAQVQTAIWDMLPTRSYSGARQYIEKWHRDYYDEGCWESNFTIREIDNHIDVGETLHHMPNSLVIQIAMDLGVDTPNFIPCIPKFKNILKEQNKTAYQNFERAIKNVYENPDESVALAASTLESIIKTILADAAFSVTSAKIKNLSLTKLTAAIVKELGLGSETDCPPEIATLASQLRGLGATIDDLRSDKSTAHGKGHEDYVIDDPLWANFVVNIATTLGLFLWEYYEKKYRPVAERPTTYQAPSVEVLTEDIPF